MHIHLLGQSVRFRHFRKGVELPIIAYDEEYDFDYQQTRHFTVPIKIKPVSVFENDCIL